MHNSYSHYLVHATAKKGLESTIWWLCRTITCRIRLLEGFCLQKAGWFPSCKPACLVVYLNCSSTWLDISSSIGKYVGICACWDTTKAIDLLLARHVSLILYALVLALKRGPSHMDCSLAASIFVCVKNIPKEAACKPNLHFSFPFTPSQLVEHNSLLFSCEFAGLIL